MHTLTGLWTALITPFHSDTSLDEEGLEHLIQRQIEEGVDGILLLGTTGESPTLTLKEKKCILEIARPLTSGRIPLMVGVGSHSTQATLEQLPELTRDADLALVVCPYYNKPTQIGLIAHFTAIADASSIPIVLYNVPGRTACNLLPETVAHLANHPNICGIKESSGDLSQGIALRRLLPDSFSLMCGDDPLSFPFFTLGYDGLISVASNLIPEKMKELQNVTGTGQWENARTLYLELYPLFKALFLESNPIPIKAAMQHAQLPAGPSRLPLTPLSDQYAQELFPLVDQVTRLQVSR